VKRLNTTEAAERTEEFWPVRSGLGDLGDLGG